MKQTMAGKNPPRTSNPMLTEMTIIDDATGGSDAEAGNGRVEEEKTETEINEIDALISRVHHEVAQKTEIRLNWHQATAFFIAKPETARFSKRLRFVATTILIIGGQIFAAAAIIMGILTPACVDHEQCDVGFFCYSGHHCAPCTLLADAFSETFPHCFVNSTLQVDSCDSPCTSYDEGFRALDDVMEAQFFIITGPDWVLVVFVSLLISLVVANELRDIHLCELALVKFTDGAPVTWWHRVFKFSTDVRRFVVLPCLLTAMPLIWIVHGVTPENVIFNGLSVLFILEADDLLYSIGLGERVRSHVEEFGRISLSSSESKALTVSKAVVICGIPLLIALGCYVARLGLVSVSIEPFVFVSFFVIENLIRTWMMANNDREDHHSTKKVNCRCICRAICSNLCKACNGVILFIVILVSLDILS